MTHHRDPLFCPNLRLSLHHSFAVDWLHTLSLGVFQDYGGELVNTLIRLEVFPAAGSSDEVRRRAAVASIQADLFAFYSSEMKLGRVHTQVQRLDPSMFGTDSQPALKLHGAETNGFLHFCPVLLNKYRGFLTSPDIWLKCCTCLLHMYDLCHNDVMLTADHQAFCNDVIMYTRLCDRLGFGKKPKLHFGQHLAQRSLVRMEPQ